MSARKEFSDVFAKGTRTVLGGGDDEGYTLFERTHNDETVLVAINVEPEEKQITIANPMQYAGDDLDKPVLYDFYEGESYAVREGEDVEITLAANTDGGTMVLSVVDESTIPDQGGGISLGLIFNLLVTNGLLLFIYFKRKRAKKETNESDR